MELEAVINNIKRLRELIHAQKLWQQPLKLSALVTQLAVLNSYLGDYYAVAERDAALAETGVEVERNRAYTDWRKADNSIEDSKMHAQSATTAAKTEQISLKYQALMLKTLRLDTSALITGLQSRLRVMEATKREEAL